MDYDEFTVLWTEESKNNLIARHHDMKIYSVQFKHLEVTLEVGDYVYAGSDFIKVISIIKIDIDEEVVWVNGVTSEQLEESTIVIK